jgi:uncharacterized protein (DUF983 family)
VSARCPRCRQGAFFSGLLDVNPKCPSCGLDLRAYDAGDGPAIFVTFIFGALSVIGALSLEILFEPLYWLHFLVWPLVVLGLTLALLRPLKAKFVDIQYRRRSTAL